MSPIEFGIYGGGWRAEFFLRVARACPERFRVCGLVTRSEEKGRAMEARWGAPTWRTLDDLLDRAQPRFVVVIVPWPVTPEVIRQLVLRGAPVLSETPPAPNAEALAELWRFVGEHGGRVQVAEQYHLQPLHQARLAVATSGRLGRVTQASVSFAHGYHGISLMRRLLGVGCEDARILGLGFKASIVKGPGRDGAPAAEELVAEKPRQVALFDFGDRLGEFDFAGDQYFSWIRGKRMRVLGERGEMTEDGVTYLEDFRSPVRLRFERHAAGADGNLEGTHLQGVQLGAQWLYRNPFAPATLSDDELAIAHCLEGMERYVATGQDFYSLAEASQDHYLSLMVGAAIKSGQSVQTERQPWAF